MNTYQAKRIPLRELLAALGHAPEKEVRGELWYKSPLRQESKGSFKIAESGNAWYDFALGKGGNILDFAMQYFQVSSLSAALAEIERCMGTPSRITPPAPPAPTLRPVVDMRDNLTIKKIQPLQNKALTDYLETRGIDANVARPYVQEMYYTRGDKHYFGLAFPSQSGGFEIRSKYFKGSAGRKDISILQPESLNLDASVLVFEGFMDMLSALMWYKRHEPPGPVLVLNSTAMGEKAMQTIQKWQCKTVHLYLDHDAGGRALTERFVRELPGVKVVDQSGLYSNFKDFNECLVAQHRQPENTR